MPPPGPDVALAVVVGPRGVLLIERADRTPPLAFPGGKIEPGETPLEAAARETLEETGVRVTCSAEIGARVHPQTGAAITYVAASPVVGDPLLTENSREVRSVSWWPVTQVLARLTGAVDPVVHEYLAVRSPVGDP